MKKALEYINRWKRNRKYVETSEWYSGIAYYNEKRTRNIETLDVDEAKEACKIAAEETTEENAEAAAKFMYQSMIDFGKTKKDSIDIASKLYAKLTKKELNAKQFFKTN